MPKVTVELIHEVAREQLPADQVTDLIKEIERRAQEDADAAAEEKEPTQKKQFVILLSDPTGRLSPEFFEASGFDCFVGWVAQIPEDDDTATTLDKLSRAAYAYNASKKGRRHPVKTVGEACEAVSSRFFKEQDLVIKTKIPILVLVTDNRIPVCAEGGVG